MESIALENQLFNWETWDEMDVNDFLYYDITLKVPIGEFKSGHKFHSAFWKASESIIAFYDQDDTEYVFELKVSVGEKVPADQSSCGCGHEH